MCIRRKCVYAYEQSCMCVNMGEYISCYVLCYVLCVYIHISLCAYVCDSLCTFKYMCVVIVREYQCVRINQYVYLHVCVVHV